MQKSHATGNEWASRKIAEWILPVEKGCKHWKDKEYGKYCLCVTFMQRKKEHHKKNIVNNE